MFCAKCGNNNVDDASFCTQCGANLTSQTPPPHRTPSDLDPPSTRYKSTDPLDSSPTTASRGAGADTFALGFLFASRYEVLSEGRRGGMGIVYKVNDTKLDKERALKIIRPGLVASQDAVKRFRQEVAISQEFSHPNIVRVFNLEEYEGTEFFTMEWVDGPSLRDRINDHRKENTPFTLEETLSIISQLSSALSYAHQYTIHRDIKPENILFTSDTTLKLTDFGIAKMLTPSQFMTTSYQMGTPYYMAPEQRLDSAHVDHRADIYAAGVILFELLTLENTIGPYVPSELNPSLPPEIDAVFKKTVSLKPEDRYPSITDLASSLTSVLRINTERKEAEEKKRQEQEQRAEEEQRQEEQKRKEEETKKREEEEKRLAEQEAIRYRTVETPEAPPSPPSQKRNRTVLILLILLLIIAISAFTIYRASTPSPSSPPPSSVDISRPAPPQEKPAAPLAPSPDEKNREKGRALLAKAQAALKKGNLTLARKLHDEAFPLIPDDKDLSALTRSLEKAEDTEEQRKKEAAERKQKEEEEQQQAALQRQREEEELKEKERKAAEARSTPMRKNERIPSGPKEIARDGRFIAYVDGTVLDTRTNLMWAARDNGHNIDWLSSKRYCENFRGGGYTDWRMPTQNELVELYDHSIKGNNGFHLTTLITLTKVGQWASELQKLQGQGDFTGFVSFDNGGTGLCRLEPAADGGRILPVRTSR